MISDSGKKIERLMNKETYTVEIEGLGRSLLFPGDIKTLIENHLKSIDDRYNKARTKPVISPLEVDVKIISTNRFRERYEIIIDSEKDK